MRIDKLHLKKVGPFDDAVIEFPEGNDPEMADIYLLTGPNGTGKSTALYSIAGVLSGGNSKLGTDHSAKRLKSNESIIEVQSGDNRIASSWKTAENRNGNLQDSEGKELLVTSRYELMGYYASAPSVNWAAQYYSVANSFKFDAPSETQQPFSWAAFAYAGMRDISAVNLVSIENPTHSPFEQSLSFIHTANTEKLAKWVANQDFKRLKAKEAGKTKRAEQLAKSIRDIETIIAEIIDEKFRFSTSDDDNNVRIALNGSIVELGLLPDGLKSIVSWIADLLMRLDRIPWIDDIPPLEREFLLLLDEVDIHLHPAWQRKVLPIVQRMFPKAQIIASTHSPFVVASADDAHIISLKLDHGVSSVEQITGSQAGVSYSSVLRSIFGIESEFDVDTERTFQEFHTAKNSLLTGTSKDRKTVEQLADELAGRSEEVKQLVAIELRQLDKQLKLKSSK